jgi:Kef-type K+ transport system membrane component KefB
MKLQIFYDLILILFSTKVFGLLMRKIHVPEVVGALLAGVILGPTVFGLVQSNDLLDVFAELGVVMIMFTAGTETNMKQIKASGKASAIITALGVIVPMGLGYVVASLFNGGFAVDSDTMISNMFYGVMLTATSVTITVATLKELGKLQTRVGTSILSAAVLDDIIGIVILTVFIGMKTPDVNPLKIAVNIVLFFIFAIVAGFIIRKIFHKMEDWFPGTRRNVIFAMVVCLVFSYVAERFFGLADITGAFFAGIIFSDLKDSAYLEHRMDIASYMVFSPVFFASIGINTVISGIEPSLILFGASFVIVGLMSKFVGAGLGSLICGFSKAEAARVGLGMMCRAEVILITAQKGVDTGFMDQSFMPFVILLVIISSFITPILLKLTYKNELSAEVNIK